MSVAPWPPNCDSCSNKLTEPGAVVLTPPTATGLCRKLHLCVDCFRGMFRWFDAEIAPLHGPPIAPPERRAPVQADNLLGARAGTIAWSEHLEVYAKYAAKYGTDQSAERIADHSGFGHAEAVALLGHDLTTWKPREGT